MRRPAGLDMLAVDHNLAMIRNQMPPDSAVTCGDWTRLPLPDAALDAVIGDGALVFFDFDTGVPRLMAELSRVLQRHGVWLLRVFVRPEQTESVVHVHEDMAAGRIGSFHAYKWRLAMALQPSLGAGVRPAEVRRHWRQRVPDAAVLAAQTGWPRAAIDTYRDSPSTYYFPTVSELERVLKQRFTIEELHFPTYELGERCPLVALKPRA